MRPTRSWTLVAMTGLCGLACEPASDPPTIADEIARAYVDGYYAQFPEEAYETGYPDIPWNRLGDRGLEALTAWEALEDGWLADLSALQAARLDGTPAEVPYGFALQRLQAAVDRRSCRTELWNVSPTWTGWQSLLPSSFAQQPVATGEERSDALARLTDVARYLDTEVDNLRAGLVAGYSAPRSNVDAVLRQVDALLAANVEDSPFSDPAARSGDEGFGASVRAVIEADVRPAIVRYRDYLRHEYRERARVEVAVTSDPGGRACYEASVRYWSTLDWSPEEIHEAGLAEMARIQAEMRDIAVRTFGTEDLVEVLARVRTEPEYTFRSADEVLAYARAAVERGAEAAPRWFGFVPSAEVVVRPFPAFQQRSGGGFYSAGAQDGSRPGTYELGTYLPETISRAGMEATAFHETYPGHHLQVSVALESSGVHPVLQYFFSSGMGEGWALYTERLADEMELYSGDVDRLGMLSNEALRAARLVVDPGMHALGWSREQAIEYMLEHTAESRGSVTSEIDRYIAVPGQATSYLLGSLEIQRLRAEAEERLGAAFDIRSFHDLVLGNGTVTLPMLARSVTRWIEEQGGSPAS